MRYQGLLYRALNPVYARDALSGEGARRYGGRFNPKGMPALYTATSVLTAIREANQIGTLQPTTVVAYEADIDPVLDGTDDAALAAWGMTVAGLGADDWRARMAAEGKSPTQRLAEDLKANGFAGLLVRSFAKGASGGVTGGVTGKNMGPDLNLVLWTWGPRRPSLLRVVDDEGRLTR
jgi:RES domain-containing protein